MKAISPLAFLGCFAVLLGTAVGAEELAQPVWKTVYVKRVFVGNFDATGMGGVGATARMRTPIELDGERVRVYVQGSFEKKVALSRLALVPAADDKGNAAGDGIEITFRGKSGVELQPKQNMRKSDEVEAAIRRGEWFVDETPASDSLPYAYEVDTGWWYRSGDAPGKGKLRGTRIGVTRRVDVLTTDPRPVVLCYGDSITAGVGATPNAGTRYPERLAKLLDQPVLNAGSNGDLMLQNRYSAQYAASLAGVEQVILMMGINDIFHGRQLESVKDYATAAAEFIAGAQQKGIQIVIGTIPPAGGNQQYDRDPAKEKLRQEINTWIRTKTRADGVVDFDQVLADPANPRQMRAEYHCGDFVHPSDAGYEQMAQAAAEAIRKLKKD